MRSTVTSDLSLRREPAWGLEEGSGVQGRERFSSVQTSAQGRETPRKDASPPGRRGWAELLGQAAQGQVLG